MFKKNNKNSKSVTPLRSNMKKQKEQKPPKKNVSIQDPIK